MKTILAFLVAASCLLSSGLTLADIPPPDTWDCRNKKVGDTCGAGRVCTQSKCSRATRNGSVSYDCVRCQPKPSK